MYYCLGQDMQFVLIIAMMINILIFNLGLKVGLKLSMQKTKIMASSPITSWQIDGGNNGDSERMYFLGLQNHCRW